ncbi:MAG: ABC transporter permease [Clostridiales bacterium]|nr:ABC transporter permease [Clostridiales bacterium]
MNKFKLYRVWTITKKEFIHIKRDKPSLVISFFLPIMMLLIFGFAVNADVNNVNLSIYDGDNTEQSRALIASFTHSHYFNDFSRGFSVEDVEDTIKKGDAKTGLIIPPDYSKKLNRGESSEIQILVDGSDPTIARTAVNYAMVISNHYNSTVNAKSIAPVGVSAKPMVMYNPTLESAKFNIPGVVGLILQNITIILTALAMVREKELGTIEQLIMTPVTSLELIIGKLIPYIAIGSYDFAVVMLLSRWIFGVSVAGSMLELILLGFIFLVGALAMGMLISTVAKNQGQAIQGTLAFLLPSVLLSGFMFPRESMPLVIQWISITFPITHFLVILRGIILKGVGISYLLNATVSMLVIITVLIGVTAFKFTKKLD